LSQNEATLFKDGPQSCGPAADVLPLIRWGTPMSRVLTVLIAAGAVLAGAQAASAQYYGPVEYRDVPPRTYDERYDRYDAPRYDEERLPFLSERRYHDRPRFDDRYGYGRPRYYDNGPVYGDRYLEDDLFIRRRYPDHTYPEDYGDDRIVQEEEPGTFRRSEQGFDPRRPHLGDGTDAPSEQYYARRPRSCGEFFYWDGRACVDARKYPPYLGPKR
jgi:hypothetical protein